MATKPFDQTLHDQNDPLSRSAVKQFFANRGIVFQDNPDKYGIDLIHRDGDESIEVERRIVWQTYHFPYDEINLPQRKAKFFSHTPKSHYAIVSKNFSRIGIITNRKIKTFIQESFLKENKNKFVAEQEYFYKLPKDQFTWFSVYPMV